MTDFTVRLGTFAFKDVETPETLQFGGSQILAVHKLVGGKKIINAMGPDPEPLTWTGWHIGPDAMERAMYLDQLRAQGTELDFNCGELSFRVVIESYTYTMRRRFEFQYRIKLEVVEANNLKRPASLSDAVSDLLDKDGAEASRLATALDNTGITTAVNAVRSAVASVTDFAKATTAQVSAILEPIRQARALVQAGMASANSILYDVTTLGGILPETSVSVNAENLLAQANAAVNHPDMFLLDAILGRMALNVQNANAGNKAVTVAGGNLYDIATTEYGDPTAWTTIARANGLLDPVLDGVQTLKIPAKSDQSGGVLNV